MKKYSLNFCFWLSVLILANACGSSPYQDKTIRFFRKGNAELKRKNYELALQYYDAGIKADTTLPDIYNNRGIVYFNLSEFNKAIQDYDKAIQLKKDYADAYFNRANSWYELQKFENCIQDLTKAAQYYADSATVFFARARAKMQVADYQGAKDDLDKAIQLKPDWADAYDSRGYQKIHLQDFAGAEADLQKAIQINPNQHLAYANLGLLKMEQTKPKEALEYLNQAIKLNPYEIYSLNQRAYFYLLDNQSDKAKIDIEKSFKIEKDFAKNPEIELLRDIILLDAIKNPYPYYKQKSKLFPKQKKAFFENLIKNY
jgi:tetratricopeptide (TPR) repeat protein